MAGPRQLNVTFSDPQTEKIARVIRNIARRLAAEDKKGLDDINDPAQMLDLMGATMSQEQGQARFDAVMQCLRGDLDVYEDVVFDVATEYLKAAKKAFVGNIKDMR